ncbi:hypothetical protein [Sphingobacterium sp. UDSM-2020]|uniref:hypothetical protein n=1 Tax=Sphingobacterium sp. UDSM-2020 TaxID=2795738 RepID=UPI0019379655|nr:hypothetical protein [Sphingobacterium sp. UDSM-2020]QQD16190.1 hypothetical protein JAZ75_11990 [Sphingobacterium sp. UDSM-2020]
MKKLSLTELKAMSTKVNALQNLESIKGGAMASCHQKEGSLIKTVKPGDVRQQ